ncbi:sodium-dependent glucose transporter 1A-like isoform X2 [Watersipora subatra]|uniref:sodium-dependent glucose transporter 1A-like isoform X2 n=1 Tax=Watersipora subatra TaxID=2589382 RepID=UPI00355BA459
MRKGVKSAFWSRIGRVVREYGPPLLQSEVKDNYDVIDLETESEEEPWRKRVKETESTSQPLSETVIIELIICILAFIGRGLCLNSVGPTLIDLRQITSITIEKSAWIFVSQSLGFLIGSVLAKIILQKFNNELALAVCLAIQSVCSAFIPAFPSIVMMCLMFVGQGFAIGVVGIGVCSTCIRLGGKSRNGMFLQSVYLGVSIGSVLGPFIARPFLSTLARHTDNHQVETLDSLGTFIGDEISATEGPFLAGNDLSLMTYNGTPSHHHMSNITTTAIQVDDSFTKTHVHFYYIIIALLLAVPAISFFMLYFKRDKSQRHTKEDESNSESLTLSDCSIPLVSAISLLFLQCLLYFGIQDTYSNLLTTFSVLGPLSMTKPRGVYLTSLFWASMCIGRINGIWIAKFLSPFKMLLIDMTIAAVAAITLVSFAAKSSGILWGFTVILGLSFATINGATVSWAASHLPGNNYILSIIMVGRCAGLLILPTTVTALFRVCGAMTLMYALFLASVSMLCTLVLAQIIARRYGKQDKLYGKSEMQRVAQADDNL